MVHNLWVIIVIINPRHRIPDNWIIVQKTEYLCEHLELPDLSCFSVEQESIASVAWAHDDLIAPMCNWGTRGPIGFSNNEFISLWRLRDNGTDDEEAQNNAYQWCNLPGHIEPPSRQPRPEPEVLSIDVAV
jgi:hypothetical protein